jgi:general secretion pathway protein J
MRRREGFSLLELLIAVSVLAVLASIGFRGLGPILDTQARVQAETRRWADMTRVMEQLARDLSLALEPPRSGAPGQLVITRRGEDDITGRGARRVAWRLSEGRLEYLTWPRADARETDAPLVSVVLEHAAALELRLLHADGAWSALPAPSASAGAARALEVQVVLADGERITRLLLLP